MNHCHALLPIRQHQSAFGLKEAELIQHLLDAGRKSTRASNCGCLDVKDLYTVVNSSSTHVKTHNMIDHIFSLVRGMPRQPLLDGRMKSILCRLCDKQVAKNRRPPKPSLSCDGCSCRPSPAVCQQITTRDESASIHLSAQGGKPCRREYCRGTFPTRLQKGKGWERWPRFAACIDEGGPRKASLFAVLGDGLFQPSADTLHLRR